MNYVKIEINPSLMDDASWEEFQKCMDEVNDANTKDIQNLAKELDVSEWLASEIWYLRTRSRHSVETEHRMIKCFRETGTDNFRCTAGEEEDVLKELGY